jgi:hypothetical protein
MKCAAPFEDISDRFMRIEALELSERREVRVLRNSGDDKPTDNISRRSDTETSAAVRIPSGHPNVCCTSPGLCRAGSTSQISFSPIPYFCGSHSASSPKRRISLLASEPRAPSPISTYLPISAMPRW